MPNPAISKDAKTHLLAIRKALANRSAAVMVGAGFSRNAEGGENLATWKQLSYALATELEPGRDQSEFSPGSAARLAEQYAKVFSPVHLEKLIKRCVPDDQVSPGALHTQLLELPWSEVFTTNYDTLLERAAEQMFEASYFTVSAREDIPQSKVQGRRRIVKLHGSFPSHRPFILTEEEYRTYPERFSPFVNMVRQSLLENVFCLIGFSGDDPNFLHWLGWVRDMLDKHALPVYLFLAQEPTLGERKLYEARGVTPVVLPILSEFPSSNFKARYKALFDELEKPLENSPLTWGDFPKPTPFPDQGSQEEKLLQLVKSLSTLCEQRSTYPGWIAAPRKVRSRFTPVAAWIEATLSEKWLRDYLGSRHPDLVLLVIDCYCWAQSIVMAPVIDDIAEVGREALLRSTPAEPSSNSEEITKLLYAIHAGEENSPGRIRARVAMALLTWSRQSHHAKQYSEIKSVLSTLRREDARVSDHLIYEELLSLLQRADQPTALIQARRWRPASANSYAHVLRGSLLAELGDDAAGIASLAHAIQLLRRQQRSRPNDPGLLSQEAWACLVARHLHEAADFSRQLRSKPASGGHLPPDEVDSKDGSVDKEDLNGRLGVLVARGYSAEDELSDFISNLNAEAMPPAPSQRNLVGFNIGTSSSHKVLGISHDLIKKVRASFAWLELIERVGLPHRTSGASFYSDQMLQAAWWARFQDTPERSTGLFLRAHRRSALKPRDGHGRPHLTGWLDRHEIATLQESTAADLAQALMSQLKAELQDSVSDASPKDRGQFLIESFGRLTIRVNRSEKILEWADELIAIHRTTAFQAQVELWEPTSVAISRLMENLPENMQSSLLIEFFNLPLLPTPIGRNALFDHNVSHWVDVQKISDSYNPTLKGHGAALWASVAEDLIAQLRMETDQLRIAKVWARLSTLRSKDLIGPEHAQEIGNILWNWTPEGDWPVVPGFYRSGTLNWPSPFKNCASALLDRLLSRPFAPFSSGNVVYTIQSANRSYALGTSNGTVGEIFHAISSSTPTLAQISELLNRINEWIDSEQANILEDISISDIRSAMSDVCDYIDRIICYCLESICKSKSSKKSKSLQENSLVIVDRLARFPFPMTRTRIRIVKFNSSARTDLMVDARSLARGLIAGTPASLNTTLPAIFALLSHDDDLVQEAGQLVFEALTACIFTQRVVTLHQALHLVALLPAHAWHRYADSTALDLIDTALSELLAALSYENTSPSEAIPRESIPHLRYYATELAFTMIEVLKLDSAGARSWLEEAKNDPLPEIRLGRYKKRGGSGAEIFLSPAGLARRCRIWHAFRPLTGSIGKLK